MDGSTLQVIWFLILGFLLTGYAILDGFDLGVGILHPFVSGTDAERRVSMNSIGPLWDGNEVWLVTFGGALFAAFPDAYASVFSGFYTAFVLLLFALISRAVSLEFRSKVVASRWRTVWDWGFFAGSFSAALLFGVAVGNAMLGLPLDARGAFAGSLLRQLNPYSVLVGLFTVSMFAMHGSIFLFLKTDGELQNRVRVWIWRTFFAFLAFYVFTTAYTLVLIPRSIANFERFPWSILVVALNVLAIANTARAVHREQFRLAFLSSCVTIAAALALFGVALFPNLVSASNDPALSLTVFNASSSSKTLTIMLIIAAIGMPLVLIYTGVVYWSFRGKVRINDNSY